MATIIGMVLSNLATVLFVVAFVLAWLLRRPETFGERLLDWMLLLPVGIGYVWAGFFHVAFPEMAARSIGWQVSPFQFEIGVADLAIGITAVVSFWRPLAFKASVVWYIVLFSIGVAIGHVRDAVTTGNFSPNNFGLLLLVTVAEVVLLPWLLHAGSRGGALRRN